MPRNFGQGGGAGRRLAGFERFNGKADPVGEVDRHDRCDSTGCAIWNRFRAPEPKRGIGLAWRKTSPRKRDFIQLAELLRDVAPRPGKQALK